VRIRDGFALRILQPVARRFVGEYVETRFRALLVSFQHRIARVVTVKCSCTSGQLVALMDDLFNGATLGHPAVVEDEAHAKCKCSACFCIAIDAARQLS